MRIVVPRKLGSGTVRIVASPNAVIRLRDTCFRGKHRPVAGNFSRWDSLDEMLAEPEVLRHFLWDIHEASVKNTRQNSVCIDYEDVVGWTSTIPKSQCRHKLLEPFELNHKSTGMRIAPHRTDFPAPPTSLFTIVYEYRPKGNGSIDWVTIHSAYPGDDVGEICGDITKREGVVFFDWNHPGIPLLQ